MDTRDLYFFLQVHQYGSLSRAAEHLYISQQGLGLAIDRLEDELGCRLFTRGPRGTALTAIGQHLLPLAERMLAAEQECRRQLGSAGRPAPPLRVTCAFGAYSLLVDGLITSYAGTQPQSVQYEMTEHPDRLCMETLEKGRADLCFATAPPGGKAFQHKLVARHPVCALVHESHPLYPCERLDIACLRGEDIIHMNDTFRIHQDFMLRCAQHGFAPSVRFEASEIALVHRMAEKGAGIGITVGTVYEEYRKPQVRVIPFSDASFTWDIYCCANAKAVLYGAVGGLWRHILQQTAALA